jgi:hydrogenase maturation protein HypF
MIEKQSTYHIHIYGLVQGVGFRPFVVQLAKKCGITGTVKNDGGIVALIASGDPDGIGRFLNAIQNEAPPGAEITDITAEEIPCLGFPDFTIVQSGSAPDDAPLVPADLPLCADCRKEMYDSADRRYKNAFISCVSCGPRYSIIGELPYDRCRTTMRDFEMCPDCKEEYTSGGRRDFAQTISCNDCGPYLIWKDSKCELLEGAAFEKAAEILRTDGVIAVKGIGGYHFVCSPFSQKAVARLRFLKQRDKKPFAVMFKSTGEIRKHCAVNVSEEKLLLSSARPIVLLSCSGSELAPDVCGKSRYLGAFLPYTPLQELLMDACGPLVTTSANLTDRPIMKEDEEVLSVYGADPHNLDGVLYNKRRILISLDDSVVRVAAGKAQVIRRSRGLVPSPITLPVCSKEHLFAAGGDLKASFCLAAGNRAYMSQYFGDLDGRDVLDVYAQNYRHMTSLFSIRPRAAACDLHPDYRSARFAEELGLPLLHVQHHHAHIASVLAEHGIMKKVIGVAFDGTGWGEDGAVWGGEFLVCEGPDYKRAGHLSYVKLCGGDNAARDAALCADAYLLAAEKAGLDDRYDTVKAAVKNNVAVYKTSSMGRLFDAVSAILGAGVYNSFEGECAIALENLAWRALDEGKEPYPVYFESARQNGILVADQTRLAGEIADAFLSGADPGSIALGFHRAVLWMVINFCVQLRKEYETNTVALSGGVFANSMLLEDCADGLEKHGFEVYINRKVPMNDGGVALGQAFIAAQKTE